MIKNVVAALACGVCTVAIAAPAQAQTREYRIPAGSLKSALDAYARQSGRQVIYKVDEVRRARSPGTRGNISAEAALAAILAETGFRARSDSSGALAIVRTSVAGSSSPAAAGSSPSPSSANSQMTEEAREAEDVPEILVTGRRDWSLNAGIRRSEDDSQPFIVFDQEEIRRSGAVDVETFLRNQLTANASAATGEQSLAAQNNVNRSSINLRGLGSRDTLILVDGRRQAGINTGLGTIEQASITGIPLASIERIEVLASSASGIYGLGASGGVINIILRRDYTGGEITATYADTTDLKAANKRLDVTYSFNLEGGRTNVSFNGSYQHQNPLLNNERDLLRRGRQFAFDNDPNFFRDSGPIGSTPNITSQNGTPLQLKPQFGGTNLGSIFTSVPSGYRGVALDGVAPLVANAGLLNLELSDSAANDGGRQPLIFRSDQWSTSVAVRREFTDWLRVYVEGAASRSTSFSPFSRVPNAQLILPASAPNNPFTQAIRVSLPAVGADEVSKSVNENLRFVAGAVVKLPYDWSGALDLSFNRSRYSGLDRPAGLDGASATGLTNGQLDILSDVATNPLPYTFIQSRYGFVRTPAETRIWVGTAKVAGPIPIRLPAGRPTLSLNLEQSNDYSGEAREIVNEFNRSFITFAPKRSQKISSVYGEIRIPLISSAMSVPLIEEQELQIAARHERYKGRGSGINYDCFRSAVPFPSDDFVTSTECPSANRPVEYATSSNSHTDPSVSLKWKVARDVTFRGSYAKGYLPPRLSDLLRVEVPSLLIAARDPQRGGEQIGTPLFGVLGSIPGFAGGNPDVKPETSETLTGGVILTPRFVPGFRFSADWTRIKKRDLYYSATPLLLGLFSPNPTSGQAGFEEFLAFFPERFVRGPASGGFAVGPITSIDISTVNLVSADVEAVDFNADYARDLWGGSLQLSGNATLLLTQRVRVLPSLPVIDTVGVGSANFTAGGTDNGSLEWKGNASVRWSNERFSVGWAGRYFDGYFVNANRSFAPAQGSAKIPSQFYQDVFGTYTIADGFTARAGINNIFNKRGPVVTNTGFRSPYSDPRLRNFYVSVGKAF